MKALILAIQKLLAVIISVFIPVTSTAPIAAPKVIHPDNAATRVVEQAQEEDNTEYEIKEEPQVIDETPADETQEPADETQEPAEEPTAAEEIAPVQVWDVSATEDDHVTMAFYDTEDTDTLLAQLAGRITAVFAPMVAYADDDVPALEEPKNNTAVVYFDEDGQLPTDAENGAAYGLRDPEAEVYGKGTVVIYGEGEMQDFVYENFMSIESYEKAMLAMLAQYYPNCEIEMIAPPEITDVIELDAVAKWRITKTNEYIEITDEMREALDPAQFLDKVPARLVVKEGVTNVSDYAFALCAGITEIDLPVSVERIGVNAFTYCHGLKTVDLRKNVNLTEIGYAAFQYCKNLKHIYLPDSIEVIEDCAFEGLANRPIIHTSNDRVYDLANTLDVDPAGRITVIEY